jgi:hypothetical protein
MKRWTISIETAAVLAFMVIVAVVGVPLFAQQPGIEGELLINGSIDGWIIEHPGGVPPRVTVDRTAMTMSANAGWVRTEKSRSKNFDLSFDAGGLSPRPGTNHPRYEGGFDANLIVCGQMTANGARGYVIPLGGADPSRPAPGLLPLALDRKQFAENVRLGGSQGFIVNRRGESLVVRLNGGTVVEQKIAADADGWIGFRVDRGLVEIRNLIYKAAR